MDMYKIMIAAFSGTNIMTGFSFLLSLSYKELFKEPVMLNYILHGIGVELKGKWKKAEAWIAHYVIGLFFVIIYEALWQYTNIKFGWLSGIVFGAASGAFGILCWHFIYRLPDHKPKAPMKEYYLPLILAHIVFASVVVVAFKIFAYDPLGKIGEQF